MYKLYGRKGSGSFAVQVLLEEARAAYEMIWVDDPRVPSFLEINPNGRIPVLQLPDGQRIYESAAMMAFLAETLPAARMTPAAGSSARARMLQWLVFLSAGLYESNLRYFYPVRYGEADSVKASARTEIDRIYGVLEADLSRNDTYLCGSEPCAADIYLAMLASWHEPDVTALGAQFPRVLAIHNAVAARSAWQRVQSAHSS
jgi:glutathione S-transferase